MSELIVVGNRVLIEPQSAEQRTDTGLVLPAQVAEQENLRSGYVVKTGPGYLTPNPEYSESETWKQDESPVRYLPLQAEPGDQAFFVQDEAIELQFEGTDYVVVPHSAIVALVRDDHPEETSDTTLDDIEDLID